MNRATNNNQSQSLYPKLNDPDVRTLRFFCYHPSIHSYKTFKMIIEKPTPQTKSFDMFKIEENIIQVEIQIQNEDWNIRAGLEYNYQMTHNFTYRCDKLRRYTSDDLYYYFDTPQTFATNYDIMKLNNPNINNALSYYINFFEKSPQSPEMYYHFKRFCDKCHIRFKYEPYYELIYQKLRNLEKPEDISQELLRFFQVQQIILDKVKLYLSEQQKLHQIAQLIMTKCDVTFLYESYLSTINSPDQEQIKQGIVEVINYELVLGLQFIDSADFFQDTQKFLYSLNQYLNEHKDYSYVIKFLDYFKKNPAQIQVFESIAQKCLGNITYFSDFLKLAKVLNGYVDNSIIKRQVYFLKTNTKDKFFDKLREHMKEILESNIEEIFEQDLENVILSVVSSSDLDSDDKELLSYLNKSGKFTSKMLKQSSLNISATKGGDERFLRIVETSLKSQSFELGSINELRDIYSCYVEQSLKLAKELTHYYKIMQECLTQLMRLNRLSLKYKLEDTVLCQIITAKGRSEIFKYRSNLTGYIIQLLREQAHKDIQEMITDEIINEINQNSNSDIQLTRILNEFKKNPEIIQNASGLKIVQSVLDKLQKIKKNEINLDRIFEDNVYLDVLQVQKRLQIAHPLISQIKSTVVKFLQQIQSLSVTLADSNRYIVHKGRNFNEIVEAVDNSFNFDEYFRKMEIVARDNENRINKYQNFLNFAQMLNHRINATDYDRQLKKLTEDRTTLTVKQLSDKQSYRYFDQFQSIEFFFDLKNSQVFTNIFKDQYIKMELQKAEEEKKHDGEELKAIDEEDEESSLFEQIQPPPNNDNSMLGFDKKVHAYFQTSNIGLQHFHDVYQLNYTNMTHRNMKVFWKDVDSTQVAGELKIIFDYLSKGINNKKLNRATAQEMNTCILNYCNIPNIRSHCEIIFNLGYLFQEASLDQCNEFQNLTQILEFLSDIKDTHTLQEISLVIEQANQLLKTLRSWDVNIEQLKQLSECKTLYQFAIESEGQNFNDLYEKLDDNDILQNSTINDMNLLANFFISLRGEILKSRRNINFRTLAQLIYRQFQEHFKSDKNINAKIQTILLNLDQIRNLNDAATNLDQNTLKIVGLVLQNGVIEFPFNGRYELQIIYDDDKTLNNEQIVNHSSRAILLGSNKSLVNQNQNGMIIDNQESTLEQVNLFVDVVQMSQDIRDILTDLYQFGHFQYQQHYNTIEFSIKGQIKDLLTNIRAQYRAELDEWKTLLLQKRKEHYFLTYIPNRQLFNLYTYFLGDNSTQIQVKSIFTFIKSELDFDTVDELRNVQFDINDSHVVKLDQIGIWLNTVFLDVKDKLMDIYLFGQSKNVKDQILKEGQVQYYRVKDENELLQSIISIYTLMGYVPLSHEILFCNKETQIHEIESFILRAILIPRSLQRQRKRMFVLADFQNLPLRIQVEAYSFIKEHERHNEDYLLTVLFQSYQNLRDNLIEELLGKESFTHFISEDIISAFFKNFSNVHMITSKRSGLGKSEYISEQIMSQQINYIRIPIMGNLNRSKFIHSHYTHLNLQTLNYPKSGFHYDIYPTYNESLNIILFEALILNCIQKDNRIYQIPKSSQFYIELSQEVSDEISKHTSFLSKFNRKHFDWDSSNIKINLNPKSKIQKICKYMQLLQNKELDRQAISVDAIKQQNEPIPKQRCIELLRYYLLDGIKRPNFHILNSYIAFAGDNLKRLERSPYFASDETLAYQFAKLGNVFYIQIVEQIIKLSSKLSQVDLSYEKQESALANKNKSREEIQAELLTDLNWERTNALFIMMNDEGTITPIYKKPQELPEAIVTFIQSMASISKNYLNEIKPFEQLDQDYLIDKILRMCSSGENEIQRIERLFDVNRIVFTRDNFLKMALIYQRLRTSQPVIIMGETGVGKTAVINYLADLINYHFKVLNIHAGITEEAIQIFVFEINTLCIEGHPEQKVIIFFDEINTNINVQGLLKEIIIDRHCLGFPLHENLRFAAACNPYKLKSQEAVENSISAGIKHSKMDLKVSRLVYTVLPLPQSILSYIWDYGSLNQKEEFQYIFKMIDTMRQDCLKLKNITKEDVNFIAQSIFKSQRFIRNCDAQWAVSLRDVARFKKLFVYFTENSKKEFQKLARSFVLSISFCYLFRISQRDFRQEFIKEIISNNNSTMRLSPGVFKEILEEEYKLYLDNIEIPLGIGRNTPLKENIFVIITCILNNIPLFITGKPGSSKTLALNLVTKSMKGEGSQNSLFKSLPAVITFAYQGSVQSTSQGIERAFQKAIKFKQGLNQRKNNNNSKVLIIFDEIGLAEISPHNPLKVLHSLLEPPQVAFVGISNWCLDASKMNRAITLSRPDARKEDLLESAYAISEEVFKVNPNGEINDFAFKSRYARQIVDSYQEYYDNQLKSNFHGLRDFYSLVQQICINFKHYDQTHYENLLMKAVLRNFGGSLQKPVIDAFEKYFTKGVFGNSLHINATDLIKENLKDNNSRHLMIITQNQESSAIQFVESFFNAENKEYKIFYGSDFKADLEEESAYKQIHDIILCMEKGIAVVLLNLDSIYQSFYDMLNQNYQIIGNQRFCKVAIGPDSSRQLVHPDFKCVLVTNVSQVNNMDAPLLNRFEKQMFVVDENLTTDESFLLHDLTEWLKRISQFDQFKMKSTLPMVINIKNTLLNIIRYGQKSLNGENLKQFCKEQMISLCNFSGILRSQNREDTESREILNIYLRQQNHYNINQLINELQQNWKNDVFFSHDQKGFNVAVYTYSSLIKRIFKDNNEIHLRQQDPIVLGNLQSQKQLELQIEQYFDEDNRNQLLFIYADSHIDSNMRLSLCKNIINNQRANFIKNAHSIIEKHICLVIKVKEKYQGNSSFGAGWKENFIDLLNGKGNTEIDIEQLANQNFKQVISDTNAFQYLLRTSIPDIISNIQYKGHDAVVNVKESADQNIKSWVQIDRINTLLSLTDDRQFVQDVQDMFTQLIILQERDKIQSFNDSWQIRVCSDKYQMKSTNLSFHGAAINFFKVFVVKYCTYIVYQMERVGVINSYIKQERRDECRKIFSQIFQETIVTNVRISQSYILKNSFSYNGFPFMQNINECITPLKGFFQEKIKSILNSYNLPINHQELADQPEQREIVLAMKQQLNQQIEEQVMKLQEQFMGSLPDYLNHNLITKNPRDYLNHFPDINESEIQDKLYHQSQIVLVELTLNHQINQIYEIYAAYWMNEEFFKKLWKLCSNNKNLLDIMKILVRMEEFILSLGNEGICTSNILEEALLFVLFETVKPSDEYFKEKKLPQWTMLVDKLLVDLIELNLHKNTKEIKTLEFLKTISQQLITPLKLSEVIVIEIGNSINDIFDPIGVFKTVDRFMDQVRKAGGQVNEIGFSKYIYNYLEQQLPSMKPEKIKGYIQFCINVMSFDYRRFENKTALIIIVQSMIKKIINIVQTSNNQFRSLQRLILCSIEEAIEHNELIELLQHFITKCCNSQLDHQLCVLFTDSIQTQFDKEQYDIDENELRVQLEQALINAFGIDTPFINKIVSIAFVRCILRQGIESLIDQIKKNRPNPSNQVIEIMNEYIRQNQDPQLACVINNILIVYVLKLLQQSFSPQDIVHTCTRFMPWIREFNFASGDKNFKYIHDKPTFLQTFHIVNRRNEVIQRLNQASTDPQLRSTLLLSFAQHFYLNQGNDQGEVVRDICSISQGNSLLQNFLRSTLANEFSEISGSIFGQRDHYLSELLCYTIIHSQCSGSQSFLNQILLDNRQMRGIFIPFIANVFEDPRYQTIDAGSFQRYRCRRCGYIIMVVDCGQLSNHRGNSGSGTCEGCGSAIGYSAQANTERYGGAVAKGFDTESESIQGYISIEPDLNDAIVIRGMNNITRQFGYVILHCLLMGSLLFGTDPQKVELSSQLLVQKRDEPQLESLSRDQKLQKTFTLIRSQIDYGFQRLKQTLSLNDDQLLTIFEHTLHLLMQQSTHNNLLRQSLTTLAGRKAFEQHFQQHCLPGISDNFASFFNQIENGKQDNLLLKLMNEQADIRELGPEYDNHTKQLVQHFRIQNRINKKTFISYLQTLNNNASKFIQKVVELIESLKNVNMMKPLIDWMKFVKNKFDDKVKKEESLDKSIAEVLSTLSPFEQEEGDRLFTQFMYAWNKFAKSGANKVREGCDDIEITEIGPNSRFQACCITKNDRDSLGFYFFILLRSFYQKQNLFLETVAPIIGKPRFNVFVHQLRDDQMINADFDSELFETIVDDNSFNDIDYGKGRQIYYNVDKIFKHLVSLLYFNKALVKENEEIEFLYQNIDSLNNVYDDIISKVAQEQLPSFRITLQDFNNEECTHFLNELEIAMKFLRQTGGSPDTTLITYMKMFNIETQYQARIGIGPKIKHILYIYELVEEQILPILIDKTHARFRQNISGQDSDILSSIIKNDEELIRRVRTVVGRMCIRQLTTSERSNQGSLFQELFNDFNESLFGIGEQVDYDALKLKFQLCVVSTGCSFSVYEFLNTKLLTIAHERQQIQLKEEEVKRENEKKIYQNSLQNANDQKVGGQDNLRNIFGGGNESNNYYYGDDDAEMNEEFES